VASVRVVAAGSKSEAVGALAGRLVGREGEHSCVLAYGSDASPLFEQAAYAKDGSLEGLVPSLALQGGGVMLINVRGYRSRQLSCCADQWLLL
jgi:hypothetical protein